MDLSAVLLFIASGITGVQPKVVTVAGDLYDVNVSVTIYKEPPRYIDAGKSSVTLYTINEGYNFTGDQFKNFKVMRGNQPNMKKKFVTKFGTTLDCTTSYAQFTYKSRGQAKKLGVYTGSDLPFNVLCLIDDKNNKAFVIAGKTHNATKGKLFAFDVVYGAVHPVNLLVVADVVSLGENITAIGLRGGKLILTQDVSSDRKAFNVITLTPIKKEEQFKSIVKHGLEKISNFLETNAKTRFSQLENGNAKLREYLTVELKRIEGFTVNLPQKGFLMTGLYNKDLQAVLKETENELLRLHKLNILGLDDKRYLVLNNQTKRNGILHVSEIKSVQEACLDWANWTLIDKGRTKNKINKTYSCAPTEAFEERRKLVTASEKILVEISEWLHTQNDERWGLIGAVDVLGVEHEINVPQAYIADPPYFIQYDRIGNVIIFLQNKAFNIGSNFQYRWKPYPTPVVDPRIRRYFFDVFGNVLNCTGEKATFWYKVHQKTYPILTGDSTFTNVCHGDKPRNRSFIIGSKGRWGHEGKVYVLDHTEIDIDRGYVLTQEITELGSNITALTTHSVTGEILLSEKVVISGRTSFNMIVLKQIHEEIIIFENDDVGGLLGNLTDQVPKIYSTYELDQNDFTNAVRDAQDVIVDIHAKNWNSRVDQLIKEHDHLRSLAEVLRQFYEKLNDTSSAKKLSALMSETHAVLEDSFNDPLRQDVKKSMDAIVRIYNKEAELSDAALDVIPISEICILHGSTPQSFTYKYTVSAPYSCALSDEWRKNERFHEIVNEFYVDIMLYNNYYVDYHFEYGILSNES